MGERWLTAFDTRQLIADRRNVSDTIELRSIEYAIVDYARTILPARCRYMWEVTIEDDGPRDKVEARDAPVPVWAWDLTSDLKMDWVTGIFHLAGDRDGAIKYVKLVGLEFEATTIDRIWPSQAASNAITTVTSSEALENHAVGRAGRRRSELWNDWIAYLVIAAPDIVREEGVDALINKVADLMAADGIEGLSRSTVQPAARAVIDLLERKKL
ncbi:MAG: hypothetical protein PGN12_07450 [Sphingomonas phyllosphaerae]